MQVAIITGSGQGLGAAAAKLFAEHGAKVVVNDLDKAKGEHVSCILHFLPLSFCELGTFTDPGACLQVAAEIRKAGGDAITVPGDVTAEDFPSRIVKEATEHFGAIDILVNNAGKANTAQVSVAQTDNALS